MPPRKKTEPAAKPRKRAAKVAPGSRGLPAGELAQADPAPVKELVEAIRADGGLALAVYRDPLGGHPIVFAGLPLDKVEPTPYQRDVSEMHVKRLVSAIDRVGRYLDPIIAVRQDGRYWTPNGGHRLSAARALGLRAIVALVLPEASLAYQILALNTEKAHNLKERALEVIRMYRGLVGANPGEKETAFAPQFEEPELATLGIAYEKRPRYSAGAYNPVVRRVEAFLDMSLKDALPLREARADRLLELDDAVVAVVAQLKEKGFESAYLKNFVVARLNPLRFQKGAVGDFDDVVGKMTESAKKFDVAAVKKEDMARMGGAPAELEE